MSLVAISFLAFLAAFLLVGIASAFHRSESAEDYLVADRSISPWLTALSAVATNNSGFMFIGLIGVTYAVGISSAWIMIGWMAGDYAAWLTVHRRFRIRSGALLSNSVPGFLGSLRKGQVSRAIVIVSAIIVIVFLGVYAAAQLKAGSKALHVLFGWDYHWGATIGIVIIVAYCMSGGIRASIWTDAAQSIVMLGSMTLLLVIAFARTGGPGGLYDELFAIDPKLVALTPENLRFGLLAYVVSWIFAGLGVTGQPHIMVRAMAIRSAEAVRSARRIYFSWYLLFTAGCIGVGLACRVLLASDQAFDPELALPQLTHELLPDILVGLTLAGLFAATMSTADSQVLSCSAAITSDLLPSWSKSYLRTKLGTLIVAAIVYVIALFGDDSVFDLVVDAWAMLGSSLGPLLIVQSLQRLPSARVGLLMILAGFATVVGWWQLPASIQNSLYAVMPGMLAGFGVWLLGVAFDSRAKPA
ncbi:MAG: sodium/proline symporter [Spirochaetales bacterium]|nr:sodium/proline symporter [Spirochaetales bacterium]MCP5486184.1 sodium/proline symporter [Spirochaetales bacterium]